MMIGLATKTAQEIRRQLAEKGLPFNSVQVVVGDRGPRIDVRSTALQKVRDLLPLKAQGIAIIVVP